MLLVHSSTAAAIAAVGALVGMMKHTTRRRGKQRRMRDRILVCMSAAVLGIVVVVVLIMILRAGIVIIFVGGRVFIARAILHGRNMAATLLRIKDRYGSIVHGALEDGFLEFSALARQAFHCSGRLLPLTMPVLRILQGLHQLGLYVQHGVQLRRDELLRLC